MFNKCTLFIREGCLVLCYELLMPMVDVLNTLIKAHFK